MQQVAKKKKSSRLVQQQAGDLILLSDGYYGQEAAFWAVKT